MLMDLNPNEAKDVFVQRISDMAIGERIDLPGGHVVRVKRYEYVLHADNNRERARWGTLAEIQDDVKHFVIHGVLPKAQGGRW